MSQEAAHPYIEPYQPEPGILDNRHSLPSAARIQSFDAKYANRVASILKK